MNDASALCDYCGSAIAQGPLGLCLGCQGKPTVVSLYRVVARTPRPPGWSAHLRRLAERARQRLPLFPRREVPALHLGDKLTVRKAPPGMLSSREVARLFGVAQGTIANWRFQGKFPPPAYKYRTASYWREADVLALLAARQATAGQPSVSASAR